MNRWIEGARPKTLVASVVPVLVGTAAAHHFIPWRFAAAMVVAVAVQIGVNYANDYFDAVKAVDTHERVGPRRLTASGAATRGQMKAAIATSFGVAAAAGVALAAATTWWLLAVGAAAFLAALAYSGGPKPYASLGLGEVFVFAFFGVVATVGSAYVQIGNASRYHRGLLRLPLVASVPVGLLATAILVANNIRDIPTDLRSGKRTLAVRLGRSRTRVLFDILVAGAFASILAVAVAARALAPVLPLLAAPLAVRPTMLVGNREDGPGLIAALVATARLQLAFGTLLAIGLWLR